MKGFEWMRLEEDFMRPHTEQDNVHAGLNFCIIPGETFMMFVARVASFHDDVELLRFILNKGFDVNTKIGLGNHTCYDRVASRDCKMLLIDRGALVPFSSTCYNPFIRSRIFARYSAILTLYTMQELDKKYKNVSIIIGRAIWASRGDCEYWLQQGRLLKK